MFLPEESPQVYSGWYSVPVKSVGWLGDSTDPVPQGECPAAFLEFLDKAPLVNRYRGFHFCGLCGNRNNAPNDNVDRTGNGEYWVKTTNGEHYVLPAMVAHYIQHHGYCPPANLVNNFSKALNEEEVSALDRHPTPEELKTYRAMKDDNLRRMGVDTNPIESGISRMAKEVEASFDKDVLDNLTDMALQTFKKVNLP